MPKTGQAGDKQGQARQELAGRDRSISLPPLFALAQLPAYLPATYSAIYTSFYVILIIYKNRLFS